MATIQDLTKDLHSSEIRLSELNNLLTNLSNEIINNWDEIKHNSVKSVRNSGLGTRMHELSESFKLNIELDEVNIDRDTLRQVLAGLAISDVYLSGDISSISTPDPHLISSFISAVGNYLREKKMTARFYITAAEGKRGLSVSYHVVITNKHDLDIFRVNNIKAQDLLNNSKIPNHLIPWLRDAINNWNSIKTKKQIRFVYYAVNGFIGRASLFGWFVGDGILGHVGRGSFDIGFSFVADEPVRRFMDEFLCGLYGCSGNFFGGSSGRGSEHYVVCPVKAMVISDIVGLAGSWPTYGLTDRVVKLVEAVRYSTPCLTYAKYPVINVLGHDLILRKHNMGRGWYLAKSTSDEGLARAMVNDLRSAGFNVSVNNRGGVFEIYVSIEDTKRILRMLGVYEKFYGEPRRLPSVDEVINVLRRYVIKRWHVHVARARNGRGYEYTESCVLISLGDSGEARRLRDELVGLGIRVRKVVWGTVIICNGEDRELLINALSIVKPQ
ncbi:hypothetical protein JCM16161A_22620 [Vulcanisaeta sp. JCM 16161]|uniref:hypothetical protein n=1 Tax=Vulcanisaeta sp. JCM 16161 TaxID=1295372 RepID=UPI00406CE1D1